MTRIVALHASVRMSPTLLVLIAEPLLNPARQHPEIQIDDH
jgi:hypothetical protein